MLKVIKSQPGGPPAPNPSSPSPAGGGGAPRSAEGAQGELTEGFLIDNRYQILRRASRWTVGDTYLAHDLSFNETVVLVTPDVPPPQVAGFLQRLRVDAERTRPLHRGPVVTIRDAGLLPSGRSFFTLRHVPGTSLWRHIKSEGPLPTEVALRLFEALVHRIKQAHDIGVYLGDIRPANILLVETADGVAPEIIDLGYARNLFDGALSLPAPSPAYRSPQQRRRLPLSPGDDIYALGAVLYFMLTARPPRAGNTEDPAIMVGADMGEPITPPSNVRPDLDFPMYVDQVVLTALSSRPEERYRTLGNVLQGVEGLMELFSLSPKARAMLYNEGKEEETTMDVQPTAPELQGHLGQGPAQSQPVFQSNHGMPQPPPTPVTPHPAPARPRRAQEPMTRPFGPGLGVPPPQIPGAQIPGAQIPGAQAPSASGSSPGTRPFDPAELSRSAGSGNAAEDAYQALDGAWSGQQAVRRESPGREEVWSTGTIPMTMRPAATPSAPQNVDPPTRPLAPAQIDAMPMPGAPAPNPGPMQVPEAADTTAHTPVLPSLQQMAAGPAQQSQLPGNATQRVPDDHAFQLAPQPELQRGASASEKLPNREERLNQTGADPFSADPLQLEAEPLGVNAVPPPSSRPERRQRLAMGLVAVGLLTAASLGGFLVMKKSRDKENFLPAPETASAMAKNIAEGGPSDPAPPGLPPTVPNPGAPGALAALPPMADTGLAEATPDAAAQAPTPSKLVKLEMVTEPAGAEVVAVDTSELVCKQTPCTFDRPREAGGNLVVRVTHEGYESIVRPLPLDKDNSFKLVMDVLPAEVAAEAPKPKPKPSRRKSPGRKASKPSGLNTAASPASSAPAVASKPSKPPSTAKAKPASGGALFGDDPFGDDPFGSSPSPKPATPPPAAPPSGGDLFGDDPFGDSPAPKPAPKPATKPAAKPSGGDLFGDDPFADTPAPKPAKKPAKKPATKPAAKPAGGDLFGDDPFGDDPFGSSPAPKKTTPTPKPKPAENDLFDNPFE